MLRIGNVSLLGGSTVGRAPKFVSIGYFCGHLVTSVLLIELCPMVPFAAKVPHGVSQPTLPYSDLDHRDRGQSPHTAVQIW